MMDGYFTDRLPEWGWPIFPSSSTAMKMRGPPWTANSARFSPAKIEERMNYRIAGYFENGFRQVSNRLRPVRVPADMKDMRIRVLPSKIQARTFALLGATPLIMDLTEAIQGVKAGTLDAQENPFFNTVTYGVHKFITSTP